MRTLLSLILLLTFSTAFSQRLAQNSYWFWLRDKEGTAYTVEQPELFLSQRSLDRRSYQGLPVDERDLPVSERYLDSLRAKGLTIRYTSRWLNAVAVDLTEEISEAEVKTWSFISTYPWSPDPEVLYYPPKSQTNRFATPDPGIGSFRYGMASAQIGQIGLNRLHQLGYTGKGVLIGVLDAGFIMADRLPAFDSLFAEGRIIDQYDFVGKSSQVFDYHTHGMSVLSIIGGNYPGALIGTAPHASFVLARTENGLGELKMEEASWIAGAEWADSLGVDVINSSLGYFQFDFPEMDYTYEDLDGQTALVSRAASLLASRGIVLSNSAGNEGASDWYYIITPADAENIITVGAVDSTGNIAFFSSRGLTYDNRIKPDLCAMGYGTAIQLTDSTIGRGNGTSFSSPVMAGATACMWQAFPEMKAADLIKAITNLGDRWNSPDIAYGFGIPDFSMALSSSTGEMMKQGSIVLYPNPCSGSFYYLTPGKSPSGPVDHISVYSIQGSLILSKQGCSGPIEIPPGTTAGLYIVEIQNANGRFTGRLIIE